MNPIEQIKDRISILDVVSTYLRVEKSGNQYKARCPFHSEKTPSFYVSPSRNSFHCFGCGKNGDIFTFVEEVEHIPFKEALVLLAERAGVKLENRGGRKEDGSLLEILSESAVFFQKNLGSHPAVMSYALSRGMTEGTIGTFKIGYSETAWRTLYDHLKKLGYNDTDIEKSGVAIKTEKGYYDRFRGRLMFPITSPSGKVVGFTGRVLPETQAASDKPLAKYINTPETELYHKSKILFGYDKAKNSIAEKDLCVVVEGQMDTIMSQQCGVLNTVGVSGTAFTEEQLTLIMRMTKNIVLSFDSDKAGQNAMIRSAELGLLADANIEVIDLGTQKDPADIIIENPSFWKEAIEKRTHVIDYLLKHIRTEIKDDRQYALEVRRVILPLTSRIKSHIDRDYFLKRIGADIGVTIDSVREDLKQFVTTHGVEEKNDGEVTVNTKTRILVTYEEIIGNIELDPGLYAADIKELFLEIYSENIPEIIQYEDIPESEKNRLQIRTEILNSDAELRKRNFPSIVLECKKRLLDIQIQKLRDNPEFAQSEKIQFEYQELKKKQDKLK